MPLDSNGLSADMSPVEVPEPAAAPSLEELAFSPAVLLGAGLKAAREAKGLTVEDIAETTRVRRQYLVSIEAMEIDKLPSRPFAIGYVRAYARELGIDENRAIDKFKADAPDADGGLRAPVGVTAERDPRVGLIVMGAVFVIGAIVLWNVAQRGMAAKAPPSAPVAAAPAPAPTGPAAVALGKALPPPVESTVPPPYVTPGLEAELGAPPPTDAKVQTLPEAPISDPRAQAFGAPPEQSAVVLRARKSASLIIRNPDGAPSFARQLAPSETYRLPMGAPLTVEVYDPTAFDVFVRGQFTGQLPDLVTAAAKLGG